MTAIAANAELNFLDSAVPSSLHRTGAVYTRRDEDGNDAGTEGLVVDKHAVPILDARAAEVAPTLAANGFEVLDDPLGSAVPDFLDHASVVDRYYAACEALVAAVSGASRVHAFDHNVRSASGRAAGQRLAGGQDVQAPLHFVHGDYTLTSAPDRLRQLAQAPSRNDTYVHRLGPGETLVDPALAAAALAGERRFEIINVWRNIAAEPIATRPLALCDGRSVGPADLVVFEIHYVDRIGENYFAKYAPRQRWFTYPALTRDEPLLIKQWDSAGTLARSDGARGDGAADGPCTFSFHSAFKDPATPPDAPDRWSIEVRCMAIHD
ncbi:MAG: CmcJ/NvfI family oxidoreductase [Pseudomonadales bacterium]|jgi:hypothetical protein|nr:CmcJ/NvfI family oxidoreductase [Pseudomonadales bacterium]